MRLHLLFLLFYLPWSVFSQTIPKIDSLIAEEMKQAEVAAIAVAIINSGEIVHLSTHGFKDIENQYLADIHTPFHIASVSKTVTNLAVFKLVQSGDIDLNENVNKYLPFEIENPHFPLEKITTAELLNHRSGIRDDYKFYGPFWSKPKGDPTIGLEDFLKDYLTVKGKFYKKSHFDESPDHKSFTYSNTGVALLGLIVEQVSGRSFEEFCQLNIFQPLGMQNTSWFLKYLEIENVSKTYKMKSDRLEFIGHNGYPDYPAGQLRTSIHDFAKFIEGYLNAEKSNFILEPRTIDLITPSPQISQEGYYTWFLRAMGNNLYYEHKGGDIGVRTIAMIDVVRKSGLIVFVNSEFVPTKLVSEIEKEMWGQ